MKTRTLLSWSIRNYLTVFPLLIIVCFGAFYLILRTVVLQNIDEILSNRRNNIINLFHSSKVEPLVDGFGFTDFKVQPSNYPSNDLYSDTLIFENTDKEFDEYRKLTTSFIANGKRYKLEILKAHLETEEIISTIVIFLGLMFLLLLGVFYLTTKYFSVRLWNPFHDTLQRLRDFKVETSMKLLLNDSHVTEFNILNKSILELTERTQNAFQNQKQFTENAAHEMQTPVSVIQSQLEIWIGDPTLTERQSEKIRMLLDAVHRLTKLNKTLLLLSKIDNRQFPDVENNDLKLVVEQILSYFEGQQENLRIELSTDLKENAFVRCNPILLNALLMNLIKNAFLHNVKEGYVDIKITSTSFEIKNSSDLPEIPKAKLYQRFSRQSAKKDSWGLGLAIAKRICDSNGWSLEYSFGGNEHSFKILFASQHGA